ncbi:MAG: hypothetical protein ACK5UQ_06900 [Planctomycetota bacterium]|jgi:hypothetical protein
MLKHALAVSLSLSLAAIAAAQNCPSNTLGTSLGVGDDTLFPIQPIGFAFPFAGTTYTNVHVSTNGFVYLSNTGVPAPGAADASPTVAEFVAGSPRIAAFWNDLNILAGNGAGVFLTSSAAGCTITWKNAQNYAGLNVLATPVFDVQLQLLPNGDVRVYYGGSVTNRSTFAGGQVAIVGATPGAAAPLPAAVDYLVAGATVDNTVFETWATADTFDLQARELTLVATAPGYAYVAANQTNCATTVDYGVGCVEQRNSFSENFPNAAAFDLSGQTITMLRQPGGYLVLNSIPGTIVTPSATAAIIANADDTTSTVALSAPLPVPGGTTSALVVDSNGKIALAGTGNGSDLSPTVNELLANPSTTLAVIWRDLNPAAAGSGKIKFEEVAGIAYVTWDGVYNFNTTLPMTAQVQLNLGTGDITVVYGPCTSNGILVAGFSVAGPSTRNNAIDLSTALANPLAIADGEIQGVKLTTSGKPFLGNAAFTWEASQVPTLLPVGFMFLGDLVLNPGVDLTFLGMPTCNAYSNGNLANFPFPLTATGTGTVPFAIPNNPVFAGAVLSSQVVALSLATPFNLVSSNGNAITIGF